VEDTVSVLSKPLLFCHRVCVYEFLEQGSSAFKVNGFKDLEKGLTLIP
jgi:hypothetical protein